MRSKLVEHERTSHEGIRITTGERTLIDLAPGLGASHLARAFREAIRLRATTAQRVLDSLEHRPGRRGVAHLHDLAVRYGGVPYERARSNAEARALEVLADAGLQPDLVNEAMAGIEADLIWPSRRLIIEIDGPQFHRFPDEDARKQRVWESAGFVVRRIPSDDVYNRPSRLVALARATTNVRFAGP